MLDRWKHHTIIYEVMMKGERIGNRIKRLFISVSAYCCLRMHSRRNCVNAMHTQLASYHSNFHIEVKQRFVYVRQGNTKSATLWTKPSGGGL